MRMSAGLAVLMLACGPFPEQRSDLHWVWSDGGGSWFFGEAEFEVEPDLVGSAVEVDDGPYNWAFEWTGTYNVDGRHVMIDVLDDPYYDLEERGTARNRVMEWVPAQRLVLELDPDVFTSATIELTYAGSLDE